MRDRASLDYKYLKWVMRQEINRHQIDLKQKFGKSEKWEEGFIAGIRYMLQYIIPECEKRQAGQNIKVPPSPDGWDELDRADESGGSDVSDRSKGWRNKRK